MRQLSIDQTAALLGVSPATVRRRIRAGTLTAERQATAQGFVYRVLLPDALPTELPAPTEAVAVDALLVERDWLRVRVEQLTQLLTREQEAVLRLSAALATRQLDTTPTQPAVLPLGAAELPVTADTAPAVPDSSSAAPAPARRPLLRRLAGWLSGRPSA